MHNLERIIRTASSMGAAQTLVTLGITSGEISQTKARRIYGRWFTDAVRNGRLRPVRVEDGRAGTIWFQVTDILMLKTEDAARAELL